MYPWCAVALAEPPDLAFAERDAYLRAIPVDGGHALTWVGRGSTVRGTYPWTLAGGPADLLTDRGLPIGHGDLVGRGTAHFYRWDPAGVVDAETGDLFPLPETVGYGDCDQVIPDLDGDGLDDLLRPDGVWFGDPTALREGPRWDWYVYWYVTWCPRTFPVADLDGDGRGDVLRAETTESSEVHLGLYLTSDLGPSSWTPRWTVVPPETSAAVPGATLLELGDGGDPELAIVAADSEGWGSASHWLVFYDDLLAPGGPLLVDETRVGGRFEVLGNAGDVDADGDDELFLGFESLYGPGPTVRPDLAASWRLFRIMEADPATGEVWTEVGAQPEEDPNFARSSGGAVVGDFDGNGVPDLAYARRRDDDQVQVWLYGPPAEPVEPVPEPAETGDTGLPTGPAPVVHVVERIDEVEEPDPAVARHAQTPAGCRGCGGGGAAAAAVLVLVGAVPRRRRRPVAR